MNDQTTGDNEEIDYESVVNEIAQIDSKTNKKETYKKGKETIQSFIDETKDLLHELVKIQHHISRYEGKEERFFHNHQLRKLLEGLKKSSETLTVAKFDVRHYVGIRKTLKAHATLSQSGNSEISEDNQSSAKIQQLEDGTFNQMVHEVWGNLLNIIPSLIELEIIVDFGIKSEILLSCSEYNHSFTTLVSHIQALHKSSSVLTNRILEKGFSQYINPDSFQMNGLRDIPEEIDSLEYFQYQLENLMNLLDGIKYTLWCFQEGVKMKLLDQNELLQILSFILELNEQLIPMKSTVTYVTNEIDGKGVHIPQLILKRMKAERIQKKQKEFE